MKKIFTMCLMFLCAINLTACANMSNQDVGTVTGGIAGGLLGSTIGGGGGRVMAIAAGTLAGALVGSAIGKNMDETDRLKVTRALERNDIGEPAYWHNERSGTDYEVVPTRNVSRHGQKYCREYRSVAYIGGKKTEVYGTACRQRDGSWQAVNDR